MEGGTTHRRSARTRENMMKSLILLPALLLLANAESSKRFLFSLGGGGSVQVAASAELAAELNTDFSAVIGSVENIFNITKDQAQQILTRMNAAAAKFQNHPLFQKIKANLQAIASGDSSKIQALYDQVAPLIFCLRLAQLFGTTVDAILKQGPQQFQSSLLMAYEIAKSVAEQDIAFKLALLQAGVDTLNAIYDRFNAANQICAAQGAANAMMQKFGDLFLALRNGATANADQAGDLLQRMAQLAACRWETVWPDVQSSVQGFQSTMNSFWTNLVSQAQNNMNALTAAGNSFVNLLVNTAQSIFGGLLGLLGSLTSAIFGSCTSCSSG
ncbi:unnamed protein product [Darwinula stevensoni]|uniref:Uncharacterized protein n=1 Tax=Darwinula stevensoni TaxID=69355 RepID=A0A7R8XDL6_9CRUS|nr:unnamed protein product [Darwinula stevensoni]CAG0894903.1 unnamed protein product [Darwinula stevensoni]